MDRFQWFQLFAQLGVVHRMSTSCFKKGMSSFKDWICRRENSNGSTFFERGALKNGTQWIKITNFLLPYNYLVSSITHNFMHLKNVIFYLRNLCHRFKLLFDFIYPQKSGYKLFNHTLFDKVDVLNCLKISLVLLHASGSPRSSHSKPKGISCHCSKVIGTIWLRTNVYLRSS